MRGTKFNYTDKKNIYSWLKIKIEQLTSSGPIWSQFEQGQWLKHKKVGTDSVMLGKRKNKQQGGER